MAGRSYVFGDYKQTNKMCLVYLESKLQHDRDSWWMLKSKCQKMVERSTMFSDVEKSLRKCNNCILGLIQETSKIYSGCVWSLKTSNKQWNMSRVVRNLKAKYGRCFSKLKYKNIKAARVIRGYTGSN